TSDIQVHGVTIKKFHNFDKVFQLEKELGKGGYGTVYSYIDIVTKKKYAMKFSDANHKSLFLNNIDEVDLVKDANRITNNVTKYIDHFIFDHFLVVQLELLDGFELHDAIAKTEVLLFEKDILGVGISLSGTLKKLHSVNYIHRDMKPENLMITKEGDVVIIDFGLSCHN